MFGKPAPLIQSSVEQLTTKYDLHAQVVKNSLEIMRAQAIANNDNAHVNSKNRLDDNPRIVIFEVGD